MFFVDARFNFSSVIMGKINLASYNVIEKNTLITVLGENDLCDENLVQQRVKAVSWIIPLVSSRLVSAKEKRMEQKFHPMCNYDLASAELAKTKKIKGFSFLNGGHISWISHYDYEIMIERYAYDFVQTIS